MQLGRKDFVMLQTPRGTSSDSNRGLNRWFPLPERAHIVSFPLKTVNTDQRVLFHLLYPPAVCRKSLVFVYFLV